MIYYYAHTGHKVGLERARRGIAILNALQAQGHEVQMLVNDFRAGVALKEQYGLREYVNIETVQDIDAIAQKGDSVIIDSDEDDHGRLVKFVADFKQVWRFAHDAHDRSIHGERLFRVDCADERCESAVVIDKAYFAPQQKKERILFFLRDYDHDKTILNNSAFFEAFEMELLLGNYFFVKYEDALSKLFTTLHEPEEYTDCITQSTTVVTASAQVALEAKASGAKTVFIQLDETPLYPVSVLREYGVAVVEGLWVEALSEALERGESEVAKRLEGFEGILVE